MDGRVHMAVLAGLVAGIVLGLVVDGGLVLDALVLLALAALALRRRY